MKLGRETLSFEGPGDEAPAQSTAAQAGQVLSPALLASGQDPWENDYLGSLDQLFHQADERDVL